jgi:hypothetical protein
LFQQISEGVFATYCVDGRNVDYGRTRNACAKSAGTIAWSNSATADAQICLGIFELKDTSGTVTHWEYFGSFVVITQARVEYSDMTVVGIL